MDVDLDRLLHALGPPVLAVLATLRARSEPAHRVLAWMFWAVTAADVLRLALDASLDAGTFPYDAAGLHVAFYVDSSAYIVVTLGTLAAIAVHYAGFAIRWPVLVWLGTSVGFLVWKEATYRPSIEFHEWVALVATLLGAGLVARAVLAPPERFVRPDTVHALLALLLAVDIVHVTVFRIEGVLDAWPSLRMLNLITFGLVLLAYVALSARDWRARWSLRRT